VRTGFRLNKTLRNGRLAVFLTPLAGRVKVGDVFKFDIGLEDDAMAASVRTTAAVRIVAAATPPQPNPKPQPSPRPDPPKKIAKDDKTAKQAAVHRALICPSTNFSRRMGV
jgi:hypothetical protein